MLRIVLSVFCNLFSAAGMVQKTSISNIGAMGFLAMLFWLIAIQLSCARPPLRVKQRFRLLKQDRLSEQQHLQVRGGYDKRSHAVSPALLFLLSTSKMHESPLNPQRIEVAGPFFQGWLVRVVDRERNLTCMVICGSFSEAGSHGFTNHYLFGVVHSPQLVMHRELLMPAECVIVRGTSRSGVVHAHDVSLNVTWDAGQHGHFHFTETACTGRFKFDEAFVIEFNATSRIPWQGMSRRDPELAVHLHDTTGQHAIESKGPEGWLGSRYTSRLLPCHYFVHSVGSQCTYRIVTGAGADDRTGGAVSTATPLSRIMQYPRRLLDKLRGKLVLHGTGFAHIEGNHGSCFPEGWIWSHSIATHNEASFSLVLGKFSIAGITPTNCIFYLRRRSGDIIVFRTTDLDVVRHAVRADDGQLQLNATSILKNTRVEMTITPQTTVEQGKFGITVHVPTATGFSNDPGCKETYTAVATVRVYKGVLCNIVAEKYAFPLTALEYGGTFTNLLSHK